MGGAVLGGEGGEKKKEKKKGGGRGKLSQKTAAERKALDVAYAGLPDT